MLFFNSNGVRQPFDASPVNVINSIVITKETDTSAVLAEWVAFDPSITVYSELTSTQAVRLFLNWSNQNGAIELHQGDFFTFVVPDIFSYEYINNVSDAAIENEEGEIVATYSIYDNINNMKEVRITFTDYVETHTNISGFFWMLLFVATVTSTEQQNIEFIINDAVIAEAEITVNPNTGVLTPQNNKNGFSSPSKSAGGYYIFEWLVYVNMNENAANGFNTLENFSFEDIIPLNSPHVFLTDEIRQNLGIAPTEYQPQIGEYTGADAVLPANRYPLFYSHFNSTGNNIWYNFINWHTLANGLTTVGIDGAAGLNVAGVETADKSFSADLGTLTRPTAIRFFTISTIRITEEALGDVEVVGLFQNTFTGNYGENLSSSLTLYRFEAGGGAQGIFGEYSFSFNKINASGAGLPGAMFSLFTSDDFAAGASRFVFSDANGLVAFNNLPAGIYYLLETTPPINYTPNNTVYMVVLNSAGFEIYYGENFENRLSDVGNSIVNQSESEIMPVLVTLVGTKNLIGANLESGIFGFVVKDSDENIVATGTNNANGSIYFSVIGFNAPGIYTFTVEEAHGNYSGIIYNDSIFTVTVTVIDAGNGTLIAEVAYPYGGIVFNNHYIAKPVCPCYSAACKKNIYCQQCCKRG